MSTFLRKVLVFFTAMTVSLALNAQQLTNANFEDWSAAAFDGNPQPKGWNASNVTQFSFKFNFAHKETGRNGGYCMMVQDQDVGAAGITETSPGYFSLGTPWVYVKSLTAISEATAGTKGSIAWTHRPDSMSVWIKRTGDNVSKEDFYLLYYAWTGTAKASKYKGKNGNCTSVGEDYIDEESDVRRALDGNECGTSQYATQVCEGMWREKKGYGDWTNIRVPIYYMTNDVPQKMNIIFSASNYPNFRANSGLYAGNSLYVDDVELIYSNSIQKLFIAGVEWKGFDPNNLDVQNYPLGEDATAIPTIEAVRGAGSLTNAAGTTVNFPGRTLSGSEIKVTNGNLTTTPTTIEVTSETGQKRVYKIQFQKAASSNTKLAGISYSYKDKTGKDVVASVADFSPAKTTYNVELPYGTSAAPVITEALVDKQEDKQKLTITQATSVTGTATIKVTAANNQATATYTLNFSLAKLADNTLAGITVGGKEIPGFTPNQTVYKVSLPVGTTTVPEIKGISEYPAGAQTIEYTLPTAANLDGGQAQIKVTTPGNSTPKIYKLNFKLEASSYSYLKNITVTGSQILKVNPAKPNDSTAINFAPDNLTYYVTLKMGTTTLPTISAVKGDDYQAEPVIDTSAGVDGTTRITATAANGDQTTYKIVFTTMKSEISILYDLKIDGVTIDGFKSDKTSYDKALEIGTTQMPKITYTADQYATVTVKEGGVNGATRITVTAGNGNTTIYVINFSVAAYTDNTLKSLSVAGYSLCDKNFQPVSYNADVTEYWVKLSKEATALPAVNFVKQDENLQTVNTRDGGINGDYRITVRPQGGASQTYIIHFSVEKSTNNKLKMIKIDGKNLENFNPEDTLYTYNLPEGVSTIPSVTFVKDDDKQKVLNVQEDTVQLITVTAESGDKRVYRINFHIKLSTNAFLKMIYLNGNEIATPFDSAKMDYAFQLKENEELPTVTVEKAAGQQVTIITPVGVGDVQILVAPEAGPANTYKISFTRKPKQSVTVSAIYEDDVKRTDFKADSTTYTGTYQNQLPVVTCDPAEGQTISVIWDHETAWIHVSDAEGNKNAYSITYSRVYNGNAQLASIRANGVEIDGFAPTKTSYAFELEAGADYPALTYVPANDRQRVVFGQVGEGAWRFAVTADNGTDKAQYDVRYTIKPYEDAKLEDIELAGKDLQYDEEKNSYKGITLDEGAALPDMTITRKAGQTVLVANLNDTAQRVLVTAEDGTTGVYTIEYTRAKSSNAELAAILLDGKAIEGFRGDSLDYIDSLAQGAKSIPTIFPVRGNDNQTIVTTYCYPNQTATIDVTSQDGSNHKQYTIEFPARKSNNTALEEILLFDAEGDQLDFDFKASKTEYEYAVEYQQKSCPRIKWEKAETLQRVDFISRPLGQTSEIKVTAENGDVRTYKILFKETLATEDNRLQSIFVKEIDKNLPLKKSERTYDVTLPYNARSLTVEYEKMFPEQTVFVEPGGIDNPTKITVKSNRPGEEDEVYTLNPVKTIQNPAVLDSIMINGVKLAEFDPNRFTYSINVTARPKIEGKKRAHTTLDYEQTDKIWEGVVESEDGFKNTYRIICYYVNDVIPNNEFKEEWVAPKYNSERGAIKPKYWQVPADVDEKKYVFLFGTTYTGEEVTKSGNDVVYFKTTYWSSIKGAIPAMMTLGHMSGALAVDAGTNMHFDGGIAFRNTPDQALFKYKYTKKRGDGALFAFRFFNDDGDEFNRDTLITSDDDVDLVAVKNLNTDGILVKRMNIAINATNQETDAHPNSITDMTSAELYVDYIRFSYNNTPKDAWVNGKKATLSGKNFIVTLDDPEDVNIRSYEFKGQVSDQAQLLNGWSNPTVSEGYSVRTTTFRNFGEDGKYTDGYSLTVKRPLCEKNVLSDLKVNGKTIDGFVATKGDYTYHLASTVKNLPDIYPIPASSRQTITCVYADSTMTITVKPEKGDSKKYTIRFITDLSDDTELNALLVGTDVLDPTVRNHEITKGFMPDITFEKKSDLQTVVVDNGQVTVTAESGKQGVYLITRHDTVPTVANAQLTDFVIDGKNTSMIGGETTSVTLDRPESVTFKRNAGDLVLFTQDAQKMEWSVNNSTTNKYTLTYKTAPKDIATLSALLVNGEPWGDFDPNASEDSPIKIEVDSAIIVEAVPASLGQSLTIAQGAVPNNAPARTPSHKPSINSTEVRYTVDVKSEDGSATHRYTINVVRPKSDDNTLAGILVNDQPISGFRADSMEYIVVLDAPAFKAAERDYPSITYVAGHHGQMISEERLEAGDHLSLETTFKVTAEKGGSENPYKVTVVREPSHCTTLTGIMVNGVALDKFEPGRHYYSLELNTNDITIVPTSDDHFQTVETRIEGRNHILKVWAQDGVNFEEYTVDIFVKDQSNDAHLSNIFLEVDGQLVELGDYDRTLNPTLKFREDKLDYIINLPSGTTVAPSVAASLKLEGQTVKIGKKGLLDSVVVTAPDGLTKSVYYLDFQTPKSKNANLSMIYLDGDSINSEKFTTDPFDPDYYFYTVVLQESVKELPEVVGQKGESHQKIGEVVWDSTKYQATIPVQAEDPDHKREYVLVFQLTLSEADTLKMIYADDEPIMAFKPHQFFYNDSLPVGSAFPDLSWEEQDPWQKISMDTALLEKNTLIRQIHVTAESGKKNVYTLTYNIRQSDVDTLQMIYLDTRELAGFDGQTNEYSCVLSAAYAAELGGRLPNIEFIKGDTAQSVSIVQAPDSLDSKSLGYKSLVTVTAASGKTRTYIIHYPVEKSKDATLNMIMLSGKPITGFDSERQLYRLTVEAGADLPLVSVIKKEDAQVCDIRFSGDSIYVDVTAESGDQMTYSLFFERRLSSNAKLLDILVEGHEELRFRADEYDYQFSLPYGEDTIPAITWVFQDSLQMVPDGLMIDTLENGAILATITVIAPNGEDEASYTLTFVFEKNNDNRLLSITLGGDSLAGFDPRLTEYAYSHPFGSDSTAFFGLDKVAYILSDSLAADTAYVDEQGTIYILVTAQNGSENIYTISQSIALDGDNALSAILIAGDTIRGFDPEILNYTYYVEDGSVPPALEAFARSANAEDPIWREVQAGDTCSILVRAQDKSERVYKVHFAISPLNTAIDATSEDVLIKRIPGTTQIFVATLRAGVTFGLYDQFGNPYFAEPLKITPANVNDADIIIDADQQERLNDVYNTRSGVLITLEPGRIYLYGFYSNGNRTRLKSGKLMIKP